MSCLFINVLRLCSFSRVRVVRLQSKLETKMYHMNVNEKGEQVCASFCACFAEPRVVCVELTPRLVRAQCMGFDKDSWTPAITMVQCARCAVLSCCACSHVRLTTVFCAVFGLWIKALKNPDPEQALNSEIAALYKADRKKHDENAKGRLLSPSVSGCISLRRRLCSVDSEVRDMRLAPCRWHLWHAHLQSGRA